MIRAWIKGHRVSLTDVAVELRFLEVFKAHKDEYEASMTEIGESIRTRDYLTELIEMELYERGLKPSDLPGMDINGLVACWLDKHRSPGRTIQPNYDERNPIDYYELAPHAQPM